MARKKKDSGKDGSEASPLSDLTSIEGVDCPTWDDFIRYIRVFNSGGRTLYRGQREAEWKLESPWDRWYVAHGVGPLYDEVSIQSWFLDRFKDAATGLPGLQTSGMNEDQWWALGRHHGLITPLLDWTESPYVAAYFAFMDLAEHLCPGFLSGMRTLDKTRDEPIVIWTFYPVSPDIEDLHPDIELFQSRVDGAHRQRAQHGVFTRLMPIEHDPMEPIDPVYRDLSAYLTWKSCGPLIGRITISGREVLNALRDLHHMNIRPATLFPDLVGASQDANMSYLMTGRRADYPNLGFK